MFRLILFASNTLLLVLMGTLLEMPGPISTVLVLFVPQLALAITTQLNRQIRSASI